MTNIGIEAGFIKNKLTLQADLFNKVTEGILLQDESVPAEAGLSSSQYPSRNIGKVQNKGIELSVNYTDRIGELRYSIGGNLAKVKTRSWHSVIVVPI